MFMMQEIAEFCAFVKLTAMYVLYVMAAAAIVSVAALLLLSSVAAAVIAGATVAIVGALLGWCLRDAFSVAASLGG